MSHDTSEGVEIIRPSHAARMLGVSYGTVIRMLDSGALPSLRVGQQRRVPRAAVLEYLQRAQAEAGR